jgi:hypothetical protein
LPSSWLQRDDVKGRLIHRQKSTEIAHFLPARPVLEPVPGLEGRPHIGQRQRQLAFIDQPDILGRSGGDLRLEPQLRGVGDHLHQRRPIDEEGAAAGAGADPQCAVLRGCGAG